MNHALLPSGLYDLLPPQAEQESFAVRNFLQHFAQCGYLQVSPPLMEYEDTLLAQKGEALRNKSFRVMDPLSQRMMAVRADMTMQIARIAGSLMATAPRPLRLCYAGQTLRTTPDVMRSSRQFRQIGIELFGADSAAADVEVIQTAIAAITRLNLGDVSVDLNLGYVLDSVTGSLADESREALITALKRKDTNAVAAFNLPLITQLVNISGPADETLKKLKALSLPDTLQAPLGRLQQTLDLLRNRLGKNTLITIDPFDLRGFGYYSGLSFSLYLRSPQIELGRGGRYITDQGESATGFTLYIEDLLATLAAPAPAAQCLLDADTPEQQAAALRAEGYITRYALTGDQESEARALGCTHRYTDNTITAIKG